MELFPLWIYLKYYGPQWIPRLDRQLRTTCPRPILTRPFRKQFGSYTTRYATGRQNVAWFIPSCSLVLSSSRCWRPPGSAHLQRLRYSGQLWWLGGRNSGTSWSTQGQPELVEEVWSDVIRNMGADRALETSALHLIILSCVFSVLYLQT